MNEFEGGAGAVAFFFGEVVVLVEPGFGVLVQRLGQLNGPSVW